MFDLYKDDELLGTFSTISKVWKRVSEMITEIIMDETFPQPGSCLVLPEFKIIRID